MPPGSAKNRGRGDWPCHWRLDAPTDLLGVGDSRGLRAESDARARGGER